MSDKPKLILCAEDDPDDYDLFCNTASDINTSVSVIHSNNGVELLKSLNLVTGEGKIPCLIIIDMNMPLMDGREAIHQIKEKVEWRSIPIAIYSTADEFRFQDLVIKHDVKYFNKPVHYAEITNVVKQILALCYVQ